ISANAQFRTTFAGWEDRRFTTATLYSCPPISATIAPNQSNNLQISCRAPSSLITTFASAQAWVSIVDASPTDDVLLADQSFFQAARSAPYARLDAAGPIEIVAMTHDGPWTTSGFQVVTIQIVNLTGLPQVAKAWWFLGNPSDPQPWAHGTVGGFSTQLRLGPWA